MTYLLDHYPKVAAKAGPRKFLGWMLPQSLPGAPPEAGADGRGCMVLYAPKELFPDAPTLGELRYGRNGDHRALSRGNDLIVDGANKDGVKLDRAKFDPHAWAVIPGLQLAHTGEPKKNDKKAVGQGRSRNQRAHTRGDTQP